jgi:hypothetical protein
VNNNFEDKMEITHGLNQIAAGGDMTKPTKARPGTATKINGKEQSG